MIVYIGRGLGNRKLEVANQRSGIGMREFILANQRKGKGFGWIVPCSLYVLVLEVGLVSVSSHCGYKEPVRVYKGVGLGKEGLK